MGKILLHGTSRAFTGPFRKILENSGFEVLLIAPDLKRYIKGVPVFEVRTRAEIKDLSGKRKGRPYLVFTRLRLSPDDLSILKKKGLVGVILPESSPEDIFFLLNKALFYGKMLRKNDRAPVSLQVTLSTGKKRMIASTSLLSRDGMFIVTLNPLPAGAECRLEFTVPGFEGSFITGGRVLYNISVNKDLRIISSPGDPFRRLVTHPGMAVFFTDLERENRDRIDSFIKALL